jgi:molybdate transport system substrate-binding protein
MRRFAVALICALLATGIARAQDLTIFAAASLQSAFEEVARLYLQQTGRAVRFSFAASSTLARQIEQGAPAAVFASADEQWMDYLQGRNMIVNESRRSFLGNRLALVVPVDNDVKLDLAPGFDMRALLGAEGHWVTGDPTNVPVGRYAQQALTHLGAWSFARTRLVNAENVRVALAFVERGEAAAGIVYQTDAAASRKVRVAGIFPVDSHAAIAYPVALVRGHDTAAARDFLRFAESDAAKAIYRRQGFSVR